MSSESEMKKTLKNEVCGDEEEDMINFSVTKGKKKKFVKEENVEAEKGESTVNCLFKKKQNNSENGSSMDGIETSEVEKEPNKEDSNKEEKPAIKKSSKKGEKETKKKKSKLLKVKEKSVVADEANGKKKERKAFDLPGQKRDPPEERDPLRIFYETLYKQLPDSEMAAFWMMESGLLPKEVATKVYEKKQMKKLSSPINAMTTTSMKETTKSVTVKRVKSSPAMNMDSDSKPVLTVKNSKKRKMDASVSENESDDDFVSVKPKSKKHKA